ncbi:MAG: hypothetical protein KDA96_15395, partial [Planctomycetaceae bacterium]|nr:hypothetical protein [Planctomycetaceae bacterium]
MTAYSHHQPIRPQDSAFCKVSAMTNPFNHFHRFLSVILTPVLLLSALTMAPAGEQDQRDEESDYYRLITVSASQALTESRAKTWKPAPDGLALEVSGLEVLDDHRVAVAIRKGDVWILDGVYDDPPANVKYHQFATALHEPLGLLWQDNSFVTAQRSELTRLRDTDGDDVADEYETVARGWGVTGHYHEYAYGPRLDKDGNLWITLNIGLGLQKEHL